MNVGLTLLKVVHAADAAIVKTGLPDREVVAEFFPDAMRTSTFNELQSPLQCDARCRHQEEMEVVRHKDEFMKQEVAFIPVMKQAFEEHSGWFFFSEEWAAFPGVEGHKVGARLSVESAQVSHWMPSAAKAAFY